MLLAHNVYFTLKDKSHANVQKLIEDCKKYLTVQPGIVYFACGKLEPELSREVNVTDFDVGLHIVFKDRASHDVYQDHPEHVKFVDAHKSSWSKVRVFDSLVEEVKK
jgi:hypothetical protein